MLTTSLPGAKTMIVPSVPLDARKNDIDGLLKDMEKGG
jgi:hypothetical protein